MFNKLNASISTSPHSSLSTAVDETKSTDVTALKEIELKAVSSAAKDVANAKTDSEGSKPRALMQTERVSKGSIGFSVYLTYIRSAGWLLTVALLLSAISGQGGFAAADLWLSTWTNQASSSPTNGSLFSVLSANQSRSASFYISVYAIITCGALLCVCVTNFLTLFWGVRASRRLHDSMLATLLRAPSAFFDTTPLGRILNRFNHDIKVLDKEVAADFRTFLSLFLEFIAAVVIISLASPLFLLPALPIFLVFYYLQDFYRKTSRELKRLEGIARSPILAHLTESLQGVVTVRAYQGAPQRFIALNERLLDTHNQVYDLMMVVNRWLHLRLDLVGACAALSTSLFVVASRDSLSASLAGLALSTALNISGRLNWMIRASIDLESKATSVERATEYTKVTKLLLYES